MTYLNKEKIKEYFYQFSFLVNLLKNPPFVCLSSFTGPHSTIVPFSITTTLSNKSMFSKR